MTKNKLARICFLTLLTVGWGAAAAEPDQPVLFVGATPDSVYRKINQARWSIDVDTVLACHSRNLQVSREAMREHILKGRASLPEELRLISSAPTERVTTLRYVGVREDRYDTGKTFYWQGAVTMVKEDGTWRLRHETWVDISDDIKLPPYDPDGNASR